MDFWNLIAARRSVRKFGGGTLPEEALKRILEAVRLAPTAGNLQAFRVRVVTDADLGRRLVSAALGQEFVSQASAVLVFFAAPDESGREYGDRGRDLYAVQDATIAALYAHLAACRLGLGSVWVGAFDATAVTKVLQSSKNLIPVAMLPIGPPNENPPPRPRKPLADLVEGPVPGFLSGL